MTVPGPLGPERLGVLVVAAGISQRMGDIDKIYAPLAGKPLLAWTLDMLETCPLVDTIVLAVHRQRLLEARALVRDHGWTKVAQVCRGGMTRQDSVREALWRLGPHDWVAVHDGARPCAQPELLQRGIEAARATGAAVPALPIADTVKRAGDDLRVVGTLERTGLYTVQTPQVFRYAVLWQAHQQGGGPAPDDAALVERLGTPVQLFPGSADNIKVTEPADLQRAERILAHRRAAAP